MSKKFLAIVLAATMVFGSTVTAFAADETSGGPGTKLQDYADEAIEGTGEEEGLVNTHVYRVTLPVITADALSYTIDPQGLIKATSAAKYGSNVEVGTGNVFFENKNAEGDTTKVSGSSDLFSVVNKSTFPIKVSIKTKATVATSGGGTEPLYPALATSATPATKQVYLAYVDNATKKTSAETLTASDATAIDTVLGSAEKAYKYGYTAGDNGGYTYTLDEENAYEFATLEFGYTAAIDVTTVTDWTTKSAATESADAVLYTGIVGPSISVKYALNEVAATTTADIAGPTEAAAPAVTQAYTTVQNFGGTYGYVLLIKKSSSEAFTGISSMADVTSYKIKLDSGSFVDASAKGMVSQGQVGITLANAQSLLNFTSLQSGQKITVQVVIGGVTYEAVYTQS